MATTVSVVGTIATDPKYSESPGKQHHCSFRLACNDRRFDTDKQEWIDGETSWFTVNTFRAMAEHANMSFAKGDRVIVMGRLRMRDWQTAERSGTTVIIDAEALGHDIRWGMGKFVRVKPRDEDARQATQSEPGDSGHTDWPGSTIGQGSTGEFANPSSEPMAQPGWGVSAGASDPSDVGGTGDGASESAESSEAGEAFAA